MKSLLEQVAELDHLDRELRKIESKLRAGQFIDAWREVRRILAAVQKNKEAVIKANAETPETPEKMIKFGDMKMSHEETKPLPRELPDEENPWNKLDELIENSEKKETK